jgi:hypothetical protein
MMRMSIGSAAVLPLLLLSPIPSSWAQSPLVGTYSVTIASGDVKAVPAQMAAQVTGQWVVRFTADGRYEVLQNGRARVTGTFTQSEGQVTLNDDGGDLACKGGDAPEGIYKVSRAGSSLTFTKVKDEECQGRVATLTAKPFHVTK